MLTVMFSISADPKIARANPNETTVQRKAREGSEFKEGRVSRWSQFV
jgi:hypothetical protein